MAADGFSAWYRAELEESRHSNSGVPRWLLNTETAKSVYASMPAPAARQQAPEISRLRTENVELRRVNADLTSRVAKLERLVGAKRKDEDDFIAILLKGCKAMCDRIEALELRPAEMVDLDVDYDGERTLRFGAGDSAKFITLPIPLDRGVYKQGTFYSRGDVVSHQGSAWIAQAAGLLAKPPSPDWRLSVKAGRDAPKPKGPTLR